MPQLIVIGDRSFKSKKECTDHVRHVLKQIGPTESVETYDKQNKSTHSIFFSQLCEKHPECHEKLDRFKDFKIQLNGYKTGLELIIIKNDGSVIDISYKVCIDGKHKNNSLLFKAALRTNISSQIPGIQRRYV